MTTWDEAHRIANIAAAQAHRDLGVDTSDVRIDVAAAVTAADVVLFWRDLPSLFGVYVDEPGDRPGIMVNSRLSLPVRRYTAAHELGHERFGHGSRLERTLDVADDEADDASGPSVVGARSTRRTWPDEEKVAEAFAAWFLMPRRTVLSALTRLGVQRPHTASDCYQLSLILEVPYRALTRHLPNIRLANYRQAREWSATAPSKIKAATDRGVTAPASRRPAVWSITDHWDGHTVTVHAGDRLVLPADVQAGVDPPTWMHVVHARRTSHTAPLVFEVDGTDETDASFTEATINFHPAPDAAQWSITVRRERRPTGVETDATQR